ncbi:MAG: DUF523 and DUF1722 domain-containing protein [Gammaproteobacteria bacterium]|nr:DUF523 and DUF1722 domain-containing protein [Pseudomonadales bacterium]MCP5345625.1 DUF523 and DUF1722 domain-containing protein [Pseudomonadales bacterium]
MKIPVGISSCLLGENVRFDGGHKQHSYVQQTLGQYFEFRPFCPEVDIGLGIPRKPIRLIRRPGSDEIRCVSTVDSGQDFTDALTESAQQQAHWHQELCGYILKRASPSCGMERVKVYTDKGMPINDGAGIYAATMMKNFPELPVEEEGRLGDSRLRENFIQRVYVMWRWKRLLESGVTVGRLVDFHARHKLIIMSHDQQDYRALGKLVAAIRKDNLEQQLPDYLHGLMKALKKIATVGNHVNVLQHIQGYLKQNLDREDKQELVQVIEDYRSGIVPLIVPITLLNHHFRRNPDDYIARSWYMKPYPSELSLTSDI